MTYGIRSGREGAYSTYKFTRLLASWNATGSHGTGPVNASERGDALHAAGLARSRAQEIYRFDGQSVNYVDSSVSRNKIFPKASSHCAAASYPVICIGRISHAFRAHFEPAQAHRHLLMIVRRPTTFTNRCIPFSWRMERLLREKSVCLRRVKRLVEEWREIKESSQVFKYLRKKKKKKWENLTN